MQLINELEALQNSDDAHACPFILNILAEAYEEEASEKGIRRALGILERLPILDSERSIYWRRKAKRCETKLQVLSIITVLMQCDMEVFSTTTFKRVAEW